MPLLFAVPPGYRKEFWFHDEESGFRKKMVIDGSGIEIESTGGEDQRVMSRVLDWLEESIVMVRKELGQL